MPPYFSAHELVERELLVIHYDFPKGALIELADIANSLSALSELYSIPYILEYDLENNVYSIPVLYIESFSDGSLWVKVKQKIKKVVLYSEIVLNSQVYTTVKPVIEVISDLNDIYTFLEMIYDISSGKLFKNKENTPLENNVNSRLLKYNQFISPVLKNSNITINVFEGETKIFNITPSEAKNWSDKYEEFQKSNKSNRSTETMIITRHEDKLYGKIEKFSERNLVVFFEDERVARRINKGLKNNHDVFIVDVEVGTINSNAITYKIIRHHQSFNSNI